MVIDASGKKFERPNREDFDKQVAELDNKIKANQAIIEEVKNKLDKLKKDKETREAEKTEKPQSTEAAKAGELRAALKALSEERKTLIEKAKKQQTERAAARAKFDDARKRLKEANVPSPEGLEKKIR